MGSLTRRTSQGGKGAAARAPGFFAPRRRGESTGLRAHSRRPPGLSVTFRIPLLGTQFESQRVDRLIGRSARCCVRVLLAPETGQLEVDLGERHAADDVAPAVSCQQAVRGSVEFEYL